MESFEKKIKIEVDINSVESIADALLVFEELVSLGEGFKEDICIYNNMEFMDISSGSQQRLQAIDAPDQEIIDELNELTEGSSYPFTNAIDIGDEHYISEAVFFNYACKYKSLKNEVIRSAEAMVAYSKKHRESGTIWIDDFTVFGVDVLYTIASNYPEYTYLLSEYINTSWDSEYAGYAFNYLTSLFKKNGFTRDVLKAFAYCDNQDLRESIFDDQEIYYFESERLEYLQDYLKQNPNEYEFFKDCLEARFEEDFETYYGIDSSIIEFYRSIVDVY